MADFRGTCREINRSKPHSMALNRHRLINLLSNRWMQQ